MKIWLLLLLASPLFADSLLKSETRIRLQAELLSHIPEEQRKTAEFILKNHWEAMIQSAAKQKQPTPLTEGEVMLALYGLWQNYDPSYSFGKISVQKELKPSFQAVHIALMNLAAEELAKSQPPISGVESILDRSKVTRIFANEKQVREEIVQALMRQAKSYQQFKVGFTEFAFPLPPQTMTKSLPEVASSLVNFLEKADSEGVAKMAELFRLFTVEYRKKFQIPFSEYDLLEEVVRQAKAVRPAPETLSKNMKALADSKNALWAKSLLGENQQATWSPEMTNLGAPFRADRLHNGVCKTVLPKVGRNVGVLVK